MARITQILMNVTGRNLARRYPTLAEMRETFDRPAEIIEAARREIEITGSLGAGAGPASGGHSPRRGN